MIGTLNDVLYTTVTSFWEGRVKSANDPSSWGSSDNAWVPWNEQLTHQICKFFVTSYICCIKCIIRKAIGCDFLVHRPSDSWFGWQSKRIDRNRFRGADASIKSFIEHPSDSEGVQPSPHRTLKWATHICVIELQNRHMTALKPAGFWSGAL